MNELKKKCTRKKIGHSTSLPADNFNIIEFSEINSHSAHSTRYWLDVWAVICIVIKL